MKKKQSTTRMTRRQFIGRTAGLSALLIVPRFVLGGRGYVAPSDRVTLGFIGNGRQGHNLLHSFLGTGEIRVLANCDVYKAQRAHFRQEAERHVSAAGMSDGKGCREYHDFRDLLARTDIDAVVVASPDFWHA